MLASAESWCIILRRSSCLVASFLTSSGMPAALIFSRYSSISLPFSSTSPSSCWMARSCSRRKYSRWVLLISSLAWDWILAWTSESSISLDRSPLTWRSRSTGSMISRTFCDSSTLSLRFDATRSASLPGSSMASRMDSASGDTMPRSWRMRSDCSLTVRIMASTSTVISLSSGSSILTVSTLKNPFSSLTKRLMRALATPWTRIFTLPSGSLSILMTMATVPTV